MAHLIRPTAVAEQGRGALEYRFEPRGKAAVLIFHGAHMHAGFALGEEVFADLGYSVLAVSRPGYGRTVSAKSRNGGRVAPSVGIEDFCDAVHSLCEGLGLEQAAAVGISAGGPTALAMAQRHPELVDRIILQAAVGPIRWPDAPTCAVARLTLSPWSERVTWAIMRGMIRASRGIGLSVMVGQLSTLSGREAVAALAEEDQEALAVVSSQMRSGRGFLRDLRGLRSPGGWSPHQETLIIHSFRDGSVPFTHAEALHTVLPRARLTESSAEHHLIWFSSDWERVTADIREFLAA